MKILLAVDGSDCSPETVEAVASRPWPKKTIIRVLTVVPPAVMLASPPMVALAPEVAIYSGDSLQTEHEKLTEEAQQFTTRMGDWLKSSGLDSETTVRSGEPRSVILEEAQEWDADLIVLGSHGHTGFRRWLLGSVAQSVVSRAGCSVEVVRQKVSRKRLEEQGRANGATSHAISA